MSWGWIVILDSELDEKVFEFQVFELLSIIRHQCFWDSEPAYYGTPNKVTFFSVIIVNGSASAHLVK